MSIYRDSKVTIFEEDYELKGSDLMIPTENSQSGDFQSFNETFAGHPAIKAWYGYLHSMAKSELEQIEHAVEIFAAELDFSIREEAERANKKITEKAILSQITQDLDFQEMKVALSACKLNESLLKNLNMALEHKRDALICIGANMRSEANAHSMV